VKKKASKFTDTFCHLPLRAGGGTPGFLPLAKGPSGQGGTAGGSREELW